MLELTTPALLFPAIAILMLGFVNRYVAAARVIRTFRKDYDNGYKHVALVRQLKIMQERITLLRLTMAMAALAMLNACLCMLFIYTEHPTLAMFTFGLALGCMILALAASLFETGLSNNSLNIELEDMLEREAKKHTPKD
jgi:hypothetical protein